jgi:surfeit locus 1 family protein
MVVGVAILSSLGFWQLDRAEQKQQLEEAVEARMKGPPLLITGALDKKKIEQFRRLTVRGEYAGKHEILIDNATWNGKAGYHVITPFHIKGSDRYVLVNRGWIPVGRDRQIIPETTVPSGEMVVEGRLGRIKGKPAFISDKVPPDNSGEKVWFYLDGGFFSEKTGLSIEPYLLLLSNESGEGYVREWPDYEGRYGMHLAYAVQWFSFALFALFIYFWVSIKKHD